MCGVWCVCGMCLYVCNDQKNNILRREHFEYSREREYIKNMKTYEKIITNDVC